jgi:hypothetical protein
MVMAHTPHRLTTAPGSICLMCMRRSHCYPKMQSEYIRTCLCDCKEGMVHIYRAFFLGGRRGTRTTKHFVNLTGESKNFKMLEFPLNKFQILSIDCFYFFRYELRYKIVIFLSQNERTPKHFFRKNISVYIYRYIYIHTHIYTQGVSTWAKCRQMLVVCVRNEHENIERERKVISRERWHTQTIAYPSVVRITDIAARNNLDDHRRENPNEISQIQRLAGHNSITWKLEAPCFSEAELQCYINCVSHKAH